MDVLLVVDSEDEWRFSIPGIKVVGALEYLTGTAYQDRLAKVFNLCKSYKYQGYGYYVSLLAEARGHTVIPDVLRLQDMRVGHAVRHANAECGDIMQRVLDPLKSDEFELSIYFSKNLAKRYDLLARKLFELMPAPLLRAKFQRKQDKWHLTSLRAISLNEVADSHSEFLEQSAKRYFKRRKPIAHAPPPRYDLAILYNPDDPTKPSDKRAISRFVRAAKRIGFGVEVITKNDINRIQEFDALFIRETTTMGDHTYRISWIAESEGLVVMDDPQSIARCTNKVYMAELFQHHRVPMPKTMILSKDRLDIDALIQELGLPLVLKQPDSSTSLGVSKAKTREELIESTKNLLAHSRLIIAQEYLPTEFDWRIGVLDGKMLYACKYYMTGKHWQIVQWNHTKGTKRTGRVEVVQSRKVPWRVKKAAQDAARLIGDGFYGVDVKAVNGKAYVVEVNDNPNIDAGFEDKFLGMELYEKVMHVFLKRLKL